MPKVGHTADVFALELTDVWLGDTSIVTWNEEEGTKS